MMDNLSPRQPGAAAGDLASKDDNDPTYWRNQFLRSERRVENLVAEQDELLAALSRWVWARDEYGEAIGALEQLARRVVGGGT